MEAGITSSYLRGPHWPRLKRIATLLAGGRCEGWLCRSGAALQGHHHHYGSTGWESLFEMSVLCDCCHRRLAYGDSFYERELAEKRERARAELEDAAGRIGGLCVRRGHSSI